MQKRRSGGLSALFWMSAVAAAVFYWGILPSMRMDPFTAHVDEYLASPTTVETGAIKPKIVTVNLDSRKIDPLLLDLPDDLRAADPGEVGTVVWLRWETELVGSYTGGGPAWIWKCQVTVIDKSQRALLGEREFRGSDPPQTTANSGGDYGSKPVGEVVNYLTKLPRV